MTQVTGNVPCDTYGVSFLSHHYLVLVETELVMISLLGLLRPGLLWPPWPPGFSLISTPWQHSSVFSPAKIAFMLLWASYGKRKIGKLTRLPQGDFGKLFRTLKMATVKFTVKEEIKNLHILKVVRMRGWTSEVYLVSELLRAAAYIECMVGPE